MIFQMKVSIRRRGTRGGQNPDTSVSSQAGQIDNGQLFIKNPDRIRTADRIETDRIWTDRHRTKNLNRRVKSKADDLGVKSRRSFGLKQTIVWAKADDLMKADNLEKCFFTQSKRSYFFLYISKQTILVNLLRVKVDDLMVYIELPLECKLSQKLTKARLGLGCHLVEMKQG